MCIYMVDLNNDKSECVGTSLHIQWNKNEDSRHVVHNRVKKWMTDNGPVYMLPTEKQICVYGVAFMPLSSIITATDSIWVQKITYFTYIYIHVYILCNQTSLIPQHKCQNRIKMSQKSILISLCFTSHLGSRKNSRHTKKIRF